MSDVLRTPRRAADSRVTLTQLMEPTDANIMGNVHGGVLMRLADTAAGLAAFRHAGTLCVTVAVDEMVFREPVHVGDLVTLDAMVNDVGTTSLECGVRIQAESLRTGSTVHASTAYVVYVALDEQGRPRSVPPLLAETADERRRQHEAELRRESRMRHREALERHRGSGGSGAEG
jgi:acyl-CoA hydrolase